MAFEPTKLKRIIIFGRYPWPGTTKTRLIPTLGRFGAADLQRRFTEMTVNKVRKVRNRQRIDIQFCFEGGDEHQLQRWLGKDILYSKQEDSDLGTRMRVAFERAFKEGYQQILLLGTDIPGLHEKHIEQAFTFLDLHDVVLGPSTDGGYWLMGLKRPMDLFRSVDWSTGRVREQTLDIARSRDLTVYELDPLTDIDTIDDLRQWNRYEAKKGPYLSVIIPTLNEENKIKKTINSILVDEVEIIVVDGGSSDRTVDLAKETGVEVFFGQIGRARQQNHGAKHSRGKVLLFLHADTIMPEGYVDYIYEALMDPSLIMGAFRFKTDHHGKIMRIIEWLTNLRSSYLKLPYGDQAFFIRKETFETMGGFPDVSIAEDLYFARQASKRGRVVTLPVPIITSARRWRSLGIFKVTLINLVIAVGCYLGISPDRFAPLYK